MNTQQKAPKPYTAVELARFIWQRVDVKENCIDHENRMAVLVAIDASNEAVRVRYIDSSIEHKLAPECVRPVLGVLCVNGRIYTLRNGFYS